MLWRGTWRGRRGVFNGGKGRDGGKSLMEGFDGGKRAGEPVMEEIKKRQRRREEGRGERRKGERG